MGRKAIVILIILILLVTSTTTVLAEKPTGFDNNGNATGQTSETGFDQFGYNRVARIFSGTGMSWCMEKVGDTSWCSDYLGSYASDKLVMKWNAEWERGNRENWQNPPYDAWENNQWNGKVPGGSDEIWHYKYVWVGDCGADYTLLPNGGYCLWGQFVVIMSQGVAGGDHIWDTHATPSGYGVYP